MLDPEQIAADARARTLRPPDEPVAVQQPAPAPMFDAGVLGPGSPDIYDESTGTSLTAKQIAEQYDNEIKQYSAHSNRPIKTGDKGDLFVWVPKEAAGASGRFAADGASGAADDELAGKWTKVQDLPPTDPFFSLWNLKNEAQTASAAQDAMRKGTGAARSYLDTENDKTAEVQRQFKDFLSRANAVYDLQDAEQGYSMAADDQNIQNRTAQLKGLQSFNMTPFYSNDRPGNLQYSETVRPTVPNSVLPDYQLNGAVGLPGMQGFNFANLPAFAHGTDMTGIDPELEPFVGLAFYGGPLFEYGPDEQPRGFPDRRLGVGNAMRMRQ